MYLERLLKLPLPARNHQQHVLIKKRMNGQRNNLRISAGIIVIGDEILKGSTKESNSHYLCRNLYEKGVLVKKISIIGDDVPGISTEVLKFSSEFDIVFTTGGVGPTHDDRTFEGLAMAFDDELAPNEELRKVVDIFLRKTKLKDVDGAVEKFCLLPTTAKLLWGNQKPPTDPSELNNFPSIKIRNVVALPGVPLFCEQTFDQVKDYLFPSTMAALFSNHIYLNRSEIHLQQKLTQIVDKHRNVSIGSYPVMQNSYFKTRLSVECNSMELGKLAFDELSTAFSAWIVDYDPAPWENCVSKMDNYCKSQSGEFSQKILGALKTLDEVLDKYGMDQLSISFNGGKDCTLLLHLLRVSISRKNGSNTPIDGFFIEGDEFPELITFVRSISSSYTLKLIELTGTMKKGLTILKERYPKIVAVLMGSRSTDPRGKYLKSKCEWTDEGWPGFLRVCPLLDWSYTDIWKCIRDLSIPYCHLYDEGYTSLGERSNTAKNPALKFEGSEERYKPAYTLKDENLERAFREERPDDGK